MHTCATCRTSATRPSHILLWSLLTLRVTYQLTELQIHFPRIDPASHGTETQGGEPAQDVLRALQRLIVITDRSCVSSHCSQLSTRPLASFFPGSPPSRRLSSRRLHAPPMAGLCCPQQAPPTPRCVPDLHETPATFQWCPGSSDGLGEALVLDSKLLLQHPPLPIQGGAPTRFPVPALWGPFTWGLLSYLL